MKKIIGFMLCVIILTMSAGAEETPEDFGLKPEKPYAGTKLTYLTVLTAAQYRSLHQRSSQFTDLTGIEVEFLSVPFSALQEKIAAEGVHMTGTIDLFNYLDSWGLSYSHFLVPLDEWIERDGIDMDRYPKAFQQGCTYDGQVKGLPLRGHPQLLFYRKDILEKYGLTPPTTLKELEEAAKVITENEQDMYGIAMYYGKGKSGQNLFVWLSYLWSNKGDIFNEAWEPIFNNDVGVEATQRYIDLLVKHEVAPPGSKFYAEQEGTQSVMQKESAMVILWWWSYSTLTNPELTPPEVTDNIGFTGFPEWEGRGKSTFAICMPTAISEYSQNKEAAWEFLKWLTHPITEREVALNRGGDPNLATIVVTQFENLDDPDINAKSGGMQAAGAKSLEASRIMPQIPEWPEVASVLEIAVSEMAAGSPVKETLDQAAKEVRDIMKRAGYY